MDHRRSGDHVRGFYLCRTGRNVSGVRWFGALRPLFTRLAGGVCRRLGRVDRHRVSDSRRSRSFSAVHELLAMGLGACPVCARRQRAGRIDLRGTVDLGRAGGDLFSGELLEREGICGYQQCHYVLQIDRAGGHGRCIDAHGISSREFSGGHAWRAACRQSCGHSHCSRHQRHRIQLQRLSKPRESCRRGAQSRPQRAFRHFWIDCAQHRGLLNASGGILGLRITGSSR